MYTFVIILTIAIIIIGIIHLYIRSLSIGRRGELVVKFDLSFLNNKKYKRIHDVTIKYNNNTVQIDHIVVSTYGIFVIETKNMSGHIYGSEKSRQFLKVNYGKKFNFYNPIWQNSGHIKALRETIGNYEYISAVVFSSRAKSLKVNSQSFVGYISDLTQYIKSYDVELYTEEEVIEIVNKINELILNGVFVNRRHIKNVQERVKYFDNNVAKNVCPYCRSELVERNGKYGKFTGCSSYPKCKFTKN